MQHLGGISQTLGHYVDLNQEEADLLSQLEQQSIRVSKGAALWHTDCIPETIYTLGSGWAYACHHDANGRERVLDVFVPGDLAGIREVTYRSHHTTVSMLTDGVLYPLHTERLLDIVYQSPRLALAVHSCAARQQAIIAERLVNVLSNDAKARVAHFVLEIYYRLRRVDDTIDEYFSLPLKQKHLSLMLGMTHVHISRIMAELEEAKLLCRHGKSIEILNLPQLAELGDFNPDRFTGGLNPLLAAHIARN